jgi:hypothetical protein
MPAVKMDFPAAELLYSNLIMLYIFNFMLENK